MKREAEEDWGRKALAPLSIQRTWKSERLEDFSEFLLITEPELGLRRRRSNRLCDVFLCDPGSLDGRVRNDAADCADADECNPDCNNQSNGAAAHGGLPIL